MTLRHGLIVALLTMCASTAAATAPLATDNREVTRMDLAVQDAAEAFFRSTCHVGLSLAVVDAQGGHFYDYGSTSRDTPRLPTPQSVYEIASVTKTFTGMLAAKAVVDGKLTLDRDFRSYLGAPFTNLALNGHPITLRTLASHRSGLPRDIPDTDALLANPDFDTLPGQLIQLQAGYRDARYRAALAGVRLRAEPGREERYSNVGMKVIAFGLEHVYGMPFRRLMERQILMPLGMRSTGFGPPGDRARWVTEYNRNGKAMPALPSIEDAAWGLYSDTEDMARYVAWQLDTSDPVVARAHSPIVGDPSDGKALIWNLALDGREPMIWHGGGSFGTTSQVVLYPHEHRGFALLVNDTCPGSEDALKTMAMSIRAAIK